MQNQKTGRSPSVAGAGVPREGAKPAETDSTSPMKKEDSSLNQGTVLDDQRSKRALDIVDLGVSGQTGMLLRARGLNTREDLESINFEALVSLVGEADAHRIRDSLEAWPATTAEKIQSVPREIGGLR